jgi:hypothetical protein
MTARGSAWEGDYGPTSVYLLRDTDGVDFHLFGGRKQLDKRIDEASPNPGDRVASWCLRMRSGCWRRHPHPREGVSEAWDSHQGEAGAPTRETTFARRPVLREDAAERAWRTP